MKSPNRRGLRRLRTFGAIVVAAVFLAACGSGEDGPSAGSSNAPLKLRIFTTFNNMAGLDLAVAQGSGLFKKAGLDVEFVENSNDAAQSALLTVDKGETELAHGGISGLWAVLAAGRPAVGVAVNGDHVTVNLTVSGDVAKRLADAGVTADSPLKERIEALVTQHVTIATTAAGGSVESALRSMFKDFGVTPRQDQFTAVQDQQTLANLLTTNKLDAIGASPPASLLPTTRTDAKVWISAQDDIPSWSVPYSATVANADFAKKNADALGRFRDALGQAHEIIKDKPADAKASAQQFYKIDDDLLEASIKAMAPTFGDITMTKSAFTKAVDAYNTSAKTPVPASVTAEDVWPFDFGSA
jgi:ABC-type nitrate/sulfonate/bicarbonate transport system substrate-binding protein